MQKDDSSQHGQHVAGDQQQEKSGVANVEDVGSIISRRLGNRISWREVLVGWQHLGRPIVDTKHDDAPRWLVLAGHEVGDGLNLDRGRDDPSCCGNRTRSFVDTGSVFYDIGAKFDYQLSPK